nr:reverse transcriptase domain-containing protein [Tanacetum cinerariifolium]
EDDIAGQVPAQGPIPDLRSMEELLQAPTDVTVIAFHGFENDDPHSHIRRFTKITQIVELNSVPSDVVKLLLFLFSLEGAARTWLEKEPPNSITTWNDLVSKFVNRFFPPYKTTNLRNEITRFQQRFDETFFEAWDRFIYLLSKCPHHGFSPIHQIDTFYNSLNQSEQDSFNSAANGNFLSKNTQEALTIVENKSKVQTSRNKPQVSSASGSSTQDAAITALNKQVEALVSSMKRPSNSIQNGCETCGGPHAYYKCQPAGGYTQEDVYATTDLKVITTRSGVTLVGPLVPSPPIYFFKEVERDLKLTTNQHNPHQPLIPYPSRLNKEKLQDKSEIQIHSFLQMFKKLYFNIRFAEALAHMPKRFLIPCDFYELESCMALADLGRPFLRTAHALVDVHGEELTLGVGDDKLVFNVESTSKYPRKHDVESIHKISILDITCEDYFHEGDIRLIEELLNNEILNDLPPPLLVFEVNETEKIKTSIDDPPDLELKDLPPHLEYAFLEGTSKLLVIIAKDLKREKKEYPWVSLIYVVPKKEGDVRMFSKKRILLFLSGYFQIPIDPQDQEKTIFTCPYETFAYRKMPFGLCNAPGTFQRCMVAIFHDMIEKTMEVFMDDFSEKCHFMVKEGIVLGHKISKSSIELDRAKVDVITKLPPPTTVKEIRIFLGYAGFYRRFIQDFSKIARPMTHLLEKDTPFFFFSSECQSSFEILKKKLIEAPILVSSDWDIPFEIMCDASDFAIEAILGQRKDKYYRHIHYASKTLSDAQTNYTVTEKELLAVVYAFENFWSYLVLSKTIAYTDYSTLSTYFLIKMLSHDCSGGFSCSKNLKSRFAIKKEQRILRSII